MAPGSADRGVGLAAHCEFPGGGVPGDPERVRRTALHRLNEFLPRSFDTACPSDRWHDTSDFERAKIRDDHPFIACGLLRNGRAAW